MLSKLSDIIDYLINLLTIDKVSIVFVRGREHRAAEFRLSCERWINASKYLIGRALVDSILKSLGWWEMSSSLSSNNSFSKTTKSTFGGTKTMRRT